MKHGRTQPRGKVGQLNGLGEGGLSIHDNGHELFQGCLNMTHNYTWIGELTFQSTQQLCAVPNALRKEKFLQASQGYFCNYGYFCFLKLHRREPWSPSSPFRSFGYIHNVYVLQQLCLIFAQKMIVLRNSYNLCKNSE